MALFIETRTRHRADGSTAVFKVMRKLRYALYEVLTPNDASADIVTVWGRLPERQSAARADLWRRHYDRWGANIRLMA
jgi:hypothetical protein